MKKIKRQAIKSKREKKEDEASKETKNLNGILSHYQAIADARKEAKK